MKHKVHKTGICKAVDVLCMMNSGSCTTSVQLPHTCYGQQHPTGTNDAHTMIASSNQQQNIFREQALSIQDQVVPVMPSDTDCSKIGRGIGQRTCGTLHCCKTHGSRAGLHMNRHDPPCNAMPDLITQKVTLPAGARDDRLRACAGCTLSA